LVVLVFVVTGVLNLAIFKFKKLGRKSESRKTLSGV